MTGTKSTTLESITMLWLAPHFRTGDAVGGLRTWSLSRFVAERGARVRVLIPAFDPLTGRKLTEKTALVDSVWIDDVEVVRVFSTRNDRSRPWRRILYFLSQSFASFLVGIGSDANLVIAANYPPTLALAGYVLARFRSLPFVLEVRDIPVAAAVASGYLKNRWLRQAALALEAFLFRRADWVVTVSPGMKQMIAQAGVAEDCIAVIPNAFETRLFEAANFDRDVRQELSWRDCFVVLYAGTLGFVPDVMTLLETARLTLEDPEVLYVIAGGGQRSNEYRQFCELHGLRNCAFLGRLPRLEIPPLCTAADVCVNLFSSDPFWSCMLGNKNFDYLGSGTAYLYCGHQPSDTGRMIEEAGGGMALPAGDPIALRDAILELKSDRETCAEMGRRGQRWIRHHYSRDLIDQCFEDFLLQILNSDARARSRGSS
jgi:glycosyltransferase involved in cell wall biosynthesis